jgi:putative hydroxymethylpyrimidine transporter CytX
MTATADRTTQPASDEAPLTLDIKVMPPQPLGFRDQFAFWANLGVSLLGFGGALLILQPIGFDQLPLFAASLAALVGTVVGALMVALATLPGARTGAPSMALLRGLFGTKISYLPTGLNVLQLIGWGTFELFIIAEAAEALTGGFGPRWAYVVLAGVVTTVMTIWPLGLIRMLRRYVTVAVFIAMAYFTVVFLRDGLPDLSGGSWEGFLPSVDIALAVAISWVPLASDYSRFSRTPARGFWGVLAGFTVTSVWTFWLGLLALSTVGNDDSKVFAAFSDAGSGVLTGLALFGFSVLIIREVDQSFANVYSTAVSTQNITPRVDRRILCVLIGAVITGVALVVDFTTYANFLYLIGSVFLPMFAVLIVDYFAGAGRRGWNLASNAPSRWLMLLPWLGGFVAYQLINPGSVSAWVDLWTSVREDIGFTPQSWMSASLFSFLVAAALTGVVVALTDREGARSRLR